MQEKVFTELAQNLTTLPPEMRAKGKKLIFYFLIKTSLHFMSSSKILFFLTRSTLRKQRN